MKLRDLFIRIGFDVNDKPIKDLDAGIKGLITSVAGIGAAVIAAGASLFALAKTTANVGEEALHTSQMLGLSVTALQELQYAANIAGISQSEFEISIRQLANSTQGAAMGVNTFVKAYSALKIDPSVNGKMKQTDQILMEMADKFSRMPNTLEKTSLANDIFGRSGMRLIPFLNKGADGIAALRIEAESLGVVLDEQAAKQSEQFNISLKRLWASITGIKNQLGVGLMPVITELVADMKDWIMANRDLVKSTLHEYIKGTVKLLKGMYAFAKSVVEGIKEMSVAFGGLNKVVKTVTIALGALIALKLVYSIGLIAMGVYGLATAFTTMGTAALWAQIKIMAIPLLIGGAILSLIFILQDLYVYTQGGKSIFGLLVDSFAKKMPKLFSFIATTSMVIREFVEGIWNTVKGFALIWGGLMHFDIKAIWAGLKEVDRVFSEAFRRIGNIIKNAFLGAFDFITGTTAYKSISGFIGKAIDWVSNTIGVDGQPVATSFLPSNYPESSYNQSYFPMSTINNSNMNAQSNPTMNATINMTVNGNTMPGQVDKIKEVVTNVLGDWWDTTLRQNHHPSLVE